MNNVLESKTLKGYTQTVIINGDKMEYSLLDLLHETDRHTHLYSSEKGVSVRLPSVNRSAVMKDLVRLRGITADTLFQWLIQKMKDMTEYGDGSWPEVKENCEGDFYVALTELNELKALFYTAVKEEEVE